MKRCLQQSQYDAWCSLFPRMWSSPTPSHRADNRLTVEHFTARHCITQLMDQISYYSSDVHKMGKKIINKMLHLTMVDFPIIFIFVHSCHIDSLPLHQNKGILFYRSRLKAWKHSTWRISAGVSLALNWMKRTACLKLLDCLKGIWNQNHSNCLQLKWNRLSQSWKCGDQVCVLQMNGQLISYLRA